MVDGDLKILEPHHKFVKLAGTIKIIKGKAKLKMSTSDSSF